MAENSGRPIISSPNSPDAKWYTVAPISVWSVCPDADRPERAGLDAFLQQRRACGGDAADRLVRLSLLGQLAA